MGLSGFWRCISPKLGPPNLSFSSPLASCHTLTTRPHQVLTVRSTGSVGGPEPGPWPRWEEGRQRGNAEGLQKALLMAAAVAF